MSKHYLCFLFIFCLGGSLSQAKDSALQSDFSNLETDKIILNEQEFGSLSAAKKIDYLISFYQLMASTESLQDKLEGYQDNEIKKRASWKNFLNLLSEAQAETGAVSLQAAEGLKTEGKTEGKTEVKTKNNPAIDPQKCIKDDNAFKLGFDPLKPATTPSSKPFECMYGSQVSKYICKRDLRTGAFRVGCRKPLESVIAGCEVKDAKCPNTRTNSMKVKCRDSDISNLKDSNQEVMVCNLKELGGEDNAKQKNICVYAYPKRGPINGGPLDKINENYKRPDMTGSEESEVERGHLNKVTTYLNEFSQIDDNKLSLTNRCFKRLTQNMLTFIKDPKTSAENRDESLKSAYKSALGSYSSWDTVISGIQKVFSTNKTSSNDTPDGAFTQTANACASDNSLKEKRKYAAECTTIENMTKALESLKGSINRGTLEKSTKPAPSPLPLNNKGNTISK